MRKEACFCRAGPAPLSYCFWHGGRVSPGKAKGKGTKAQAELISLARIISPGRLLLCCSPCSSLSRCYLAPLLNVACVAMPHRACRSSLSAASFLISQRPSLSIDHALSSHNFLPLLFCLTTTIACLAIIPPIPRQADHIYSTHLPTLKHYRRIAREIPSRIRHTRPIHTGVLRVVIEFETGTATGTVRERRITRSDLDSPDLRLAAHPPSRRPGLPLHAYLFAFLTACLTTHFVDTERASV